MSDFLSTMHVCIYLYLISHLLKFSFLSKGHNSLSHELTALILSPPFYWNYSDLGYKWHELEGLQRSDTVGLFLHDFAMLFLS